MNVVAEKAYGFLEEAASQTQPFFLVAAPITPHAEVLHNTTIPTIIPPKYVERYSSLFLNYTIPRDPSFNPAQVGIF